MDFVERFWLPLLVVISALPGLALILRGVVWGSDSFAFWAVSCGRDQFGVALSSPGWFVWFIQNVVACNLIVLAAIMWFLYFLALLGIYFFGKRFFAHQAWRLSIYVACLTPLFFIEVLRFENDFFGWSLAFVAVGLFSIALERKWFELGFLACFMACFSFILWQPSVFVLGLAVFLLYIPVLWQYLVLLLGGLVLLFNKVSYLMGSFTQGIGVNAVSEEIPLVGLVFILHILHFYKKIPFPVIFYGWFLLLLGALKSKYMFLAVLPLIMGLLWKELNEKGLSIPKMGIEKIPVLAFCALLGIGWFFMGLNMYPKQTDLNEMQSAINLANELNVHLYNDWGDGWMLVSLGYDTNYKISYPNPDWNNLSRPFVAWSKEEILGCNKVTKKTQLCR
jgi:hypothetical protein